jgi:UDP-GlcNAc3NAcA epimerase
MKILTILGTRPQFIKAGAFSNYIKNNSSIKEIIADSGQHYDASMSSSFFEEMQIPKPKYNFNAGGLSHAKMTAKILEKSEEVILIEKPDFVIVYGDTNTTIGASLAAAKLDVPISHIEAGLRSFRNNQPEEINRILTDRISKFLFCPSDLAVLNLKHEGIVSSKERVVKNVGDIMQESILLFKDTLKPTDYIKNLVNDNFILLTLHRQENVDSKEILTELFSTIAEINRKVLFPIHPRTKKRIEEFGIVLPKNIHILDPLSYGDIIFLIGNADFIMTDSGGLQKESYFLGKRCLVLREETEWKELVDAKVSFICGNKKHDILNQIKNIIENTTHMPKNIYGESNVSEKIIQSFSSI